MEHNFSKLVAHKDQDFSWDSELDWTGISLAAEILVHLAAWECWLDEARFAYHPWVRAKCSGGWVGERSSLPGLIMVKVFSYNLVESGWLGARNWNRSYG